MPKKRRTKHTYSVLRKVGNTTRVMQKFNSKAEAIKFYNKHPRAVYIQRYTNGISSGLTQPGVKKTIRKGSKTYSQAYRGPFSKREADAHVRSLNKSGKLHAIKRKGKKGWFVYVD